MKTQINDAVLVPDRDIPSWHRICRVIAITDDCRAVVVHPSVKDKNLVEDEPGQWPVCGKFEKKMLFPWKFVNQENE